MSEKINPCTTEEIQKTEESEDLFWRDLFPKLKRYCRFLAQNDWDGDDIAQETYVKALKYSSSQKVTTALVNKIAYHQWMDVLRKRKKETVESDIELVSDQEKMPGIKPGVVEILLNQFTPKQAVILLLKEGFLYQTKEIADILGTTEMAVKASLHRARKRFAKKNEDDNSLESFWGEEERDHLEALFRETLEAQDPSVLIEAIPSLNCISENPKMVLLRTGPKQTPSSTLYMAA
nr:sigma factor-like helix-turn-helix DNA-binding protein [Neobacillus sp. Marseille-Q6967]